MTSAVMLFTIGMLIFWSIDDTENAPNQTRDQDEDCVYCDWESEDYDWENDL